MTDYLDKLKLIDGGASLSEALRLTNDVPINLEYNSKYDDNQYVGWGQITEWNPLIRKLYTKKTFDLVAEKTARYLTGVDRKGRKIVPSERMISSAIDTAYRNQVPAVGDPYGKYLVVDEAQRDDYGYIVDKAINLLVTGIRNTVEIEDANWDLNVWDATLMGDFNPRGLRQHSHIKLKERRPDPFLFNMRY